MYSGPICSGGALSFGKGWTRTRRWIDDAVQVEQARLPVGDKAMSNGTKDEIYEVDHISDNDVQTHTLGRCCPQV